MSNTHDRSTHAGHSPAPLPRSMELMRPCDTGLLLIDAQERLLKVVPDSARIIWNCRRLLDAANILSVRAAVTEQYPERLGATEPCLAERIAATAHAKLAFSAGACGELFSQWRAEKVERVLLCGIETHVCVAQTAFDLLAAGYQVFVAADAVGTRWPIDHEVGLRRMESSGVVVTTTEAAIFEWCERAGTPEFKLVSALAKELPPGDGAIVGFRAQ